MPTDLIPFPDVASLDDLIERAKKGLLARDAIDLIKDKLTRMKNDAYRDMLNAKDPQVVMDEKCYLLAIERLAKALLVDEAQGDQAYKTLIGAAPKGSDPTPTLTPATVSQVRRRRPSATTGTDTKKATPPVSPTRG